MQQKIQAILERHPHLSHWFQTNLLQEFQSPDIPKRLIEASEFVERQHKKTPIIPYGKISFDDYDIVIWIKLDTLNRGNSFKDRGSAYAIEQGLRHGLLRRWQQVVTASAGNHALGVIKAANENDLESIVFMSTSTPDTKLKRVSDLTEGVQIQGDSYHEAALAALDYVLETGSPYIHAYQHPDIIIGQSTVLTEAVSQLYDLGVFPHFFTFPVGGGGLSNGAAIAANYFSNQFQRKIFVYGVQARNYSSMAQSYRAKHLVQDDSDQGTIADGIQVKKATQDMLDLSLQYLDGLTTVTEDEIKAAIQQVYHSQFIAYLQELDPQELLSRHNGFGFQESHLINGNIGRMNILEGAAATSIASVLTGSLYLDEVYSSHNFRPGTKPTLNGVVIASGNNIDSPTLNEVLDSDFSVRMHEVSYDLPHYRN